MDIPKYVCELMERATFALGYGDPGYTLEISKSTPYSKVSTLAEEIARLAKWVERQMPQDEYSIPTCVINRMPRKTHYAKQHAVVTIYDPVMKYLEPLIEGTGCK